MFSRGGDEAGSGVPCNVPPHRRPAVRVAGEPALSHPLPHTPDREGSVRLTPSSSSNWLTLSSRSFLGDGSIQQQQTKKGFLNLGSSLLDGGLQAPSPTFLITQQP